MRATSRWRRCSIEGAELIEESGEGIDRVAMIVKEVSAFSQAGIGEAQLANVNDLLENAVNVAALSFSIVVERCYAELPPVRCDAQQLKQVFLNLLLNALQAVGDFGVIRLVTEAQGDFVQIRVEDDGCGIPEKQIEQIFDPFFTTRRTGTAAGLGLAHCYQIVRHHGGEITVQSKVGAAAPSDQVPFDFARLRLAARAAGAALADFDDRETPCAGLSRPLLAVGL